MIFNVKIDVSDLESKLGRINPADLARTIAADVADEAVVPEMAKYPSPSGKKQPFKSAQQRKFFFAALKKGQISVPYRRTGKTGTTTKQQIGSGVDVVSTAAYSDLTRTKGKQADYHKGTWPTTDEIAQKVEGDAAELIATAAVIKELQKAGLT